MATQIRLRRDTAANWASEDPVLGLGEAGYDTTNSIMKVGDGSTAWSALDSLVRGPANAGTFTPTISNTVNLTTSTAQPIFFQRIGNFVFVFGNASITPTAADTLTQFEITLPLDPNANFATANQCPGVVGLVPGATTGGYGGRIEAVGGTKRARLSFAAPSAGAQGVSFSFGYAIA